MKIFMFFINAFFWLWVFIVPAGGIGFLALWSYLKSPSNLIYSIIIAVIGIVVGIVLAEYVRKRYGLDNFFGRRLATPDIDGGNILDEKEKEYQLRKKEKKEKKTQKKMKKL
jgi:hypothetical protein